MQDMVLLLHYPNAGSPGQPLRGRHEPECWGLPGLPVKDATKVDDDSTLLLRTLNIFHVSCINGTDPFLFLEH